MSTPNDVQEEANLAHVQEALTTHSSYFTSSLEGNSSFSAQGYKCKVNDEFGGVQGSGQGKSYLDSNKWTFQNLSVNNEKQSYTNRECANPAYTNGNWNYCVENGALTIRALNDGIDCTNNSACATFWGGTRGAQPYSSGRIISKHKVALEYGYVEFKARLPFQGVAKQSGLWPAIWFLGNDIIEGPPPGSTPWPWAPEHDLMEWQSPNGKMASNNIFIGGDNNMDACNNWPEGGSGECGGWDGQWGGGRKIWKVNDWSAQGSAAENGSAGSGYQGWHTYGLEWTPTLMRPWVDGVSQGWTNTAGHASEFNTPMFVIMNLAVGGDLGGEVDGAMNWSKAKLEVDYMRWYQIGGNDTCADPLGGSPTGTCTDGLRNQSETGVDCGGPCAACPTCNDGSQNQGETSIDCGGPCAPCPGQVMLYADCNYQGTSASKALGDYDVGALGLANDTISAIKVAPGYQAVLYQNSAFGGFSTVITADTMCLDTTGAGRTSGNWNNDISSVRVQPVISTETPKIGVGSTVRVQSGELVGTQLEYPPGNGTTGTSVGWFDQGDSISFQNVNLTGVGGMNMRIAGATSGGVLEVRADSAAGQLLGSYTMTATGGWTTWADRTLSFTNPISGAHTLFLKGTSGSGIFNIETFTLITKTASCSDGAQNQGETGVDCGGPCAACGTSTPGFTIVASTYNGTGRIGTTGGVTTENSSEGGLNVMDAGCDEWVRYDNVNFSSLGSFEIRAAGALYATNFEFRRDSATGPLMATCVASTLGGWQNWQNYTCGLTSTQSGSGSLYVVFKGTCVDNAAPNKHQLHNLRTIKGVAGVISCEDSCSAHAASCGSVANNCGGTLSCGSCTNGYTCSSNKCVPPTTTNNPGSREAESGTVTGGMVETTGAILNTSTGSVCWSSVNMGGNTQATISMGNGEPIGDTLKVTFNGTQIGTVSVLNTGGWNTYQTATTTFGAQSGTGTLCVAVGAYSAWVAKVDKISFQ